MQSKGRASKAARQLVIQRSWALTTPHFLVISPFLKIQIRNSHDFHKVWDEGYLMPKGQLEDQKRELIMKKKVLAISLITVAALFGTTVSASADAASDYKTQLQAWKDATKAQQDAYKASLTTYAAAKKVEAAAKKAIADKFKTDAAASKAKTDAAVAAATTADAKKAARAAGKTEMEAIVAARNASLAAVTSAGAKPTKPAPLAKPTPPAKPVKTPKASNPSPSPTA